MKFNVVTDLKDSFNPYPKSEEKQKTGQKRTDKTEKQKVSKEGKKAIQYIAE